MSNLILKIKILFVLFFFVLFTFQPSYSIDDVGDYESEESADGDIVRGLGGLFKSISGASDEKETVEPKGSVEDATTRPATDTAIVNNSSKAQLYLYRNMRSWFMAPEHAYALSTKWLIDNKLVGEFSGSSYFKINLEPGSYTIKAALEGRPEFAQQYTLPDVRAGQSIYMRYTVSSNRKSRLYLESKKKAEDEIEGLSASEPVKTVFGPLGGGNYYAGGSSMAPLSLTGTYASSAVKIIVNQNSGQYIGTLTMVAQNQVFDFTAQTNNRTLSGKFISGGQSFPFTFELDQLYKSGTFKTGNFSSRLERQ